MAFQAFLGLLPLKLKQSCQCRLSGYVRHKLKTSMHAFLNKFCWSEHQHKTSYVSQDGNFWCNIFSTGLVIAVYILSSDKPVEWLKPEDVLIFNKKRTSCFCVYIGVTLVAEKARGPMQCEGVIHKVQHEVNFQPCFAKSGTAHALYTTVDKLSIL